MKQQRTGLETVAVVAVAAVFVYGALSVLAADPASAGVAEALEKVIAYINSKVARSLAILAVMLLGMGWWFGQVDWKRAGGIVFGIGIVFGAAEIVDMVRG
jgi:type IV secretory pathway VirB2 component (pilin)